MSKKEFLVDKISKHDLVLVNVIESTGPQSLRARVEKIYSSGRGVSSSDLGADIEFVHAPANWGRVALTVEDRALLFVSSISGKLYEDAWNGHLLLEYIDGEEYAIYQAKELWANKDLPEKIRSASIQDPARNYATAIRFEQIESYLQELIKYSD